MSLVRNRFIRLLEQHLIHGRMSVTFPDATTRVFGPDAPDLPTATLTIHSDHFWTTLLRRRLLGPGEAFVAGEWSSDDPAIVLELLARSLERAKHRPYRFARFRPHLPQRNNARRARSFIQQHYDLGNDLFTAFLDPTMTYSCAVFEHENQTLEDAQRTKYDRICRKLDLKPGMRVLEIGCGWGGFAMHAATNYGVHVTGVTISDNQFELATQRVRDAGLNEQIDIHLADYRTLTGTWDRIASIEMFEAIGEREFENYFRTVDDRLGPNGIACIQTIALPDSRWDGSRRTKNWIQEYIFPGGHLPSVEAISIAMRRASALHLHDLEEIGIHYARTLREWRNAFMSQLGDLEKAGYDTRFQRIWEFYLCFCEAGFQARILRDVQLVLTREGNDDLPRLRAV
jgi:cyclopropane-fatty-acyl-phospholipid synthase